MCEQKIEKLKEELRELIKQAEKFLDEGTEYKRWRAEKGKYYISLHSTINDTSSMFMKTVELGSIEDDFKYAIGNYFRTKKEAEEYKENLITKQKLKDLALRLNEGVEIDWNDQKQPKYFIVLNHNTESLCSERYVAFQCLNVICCLDEDFLEIAKEEIGEKALIKLIKSGV